MELLYEVAKRRTYYVLTSRNTSSVKCQVSSDAFVITWSKILRDKIMQWNIQHVINGKWQNQFNMEMIMIYHIAPGKDKLQSVWDRIMTHLR